MYPEIIIIDPRKGFEYSVFNHHFRRVTDTLYYALLKLNRSRNLSLDFRSCIYVLDGVYYRINRLGVAYRFIK